MLSQSVVAAEPINLSIIKQRIEQYVNSGQYYRTINEDITTARAFLEKRIVENRRLEQPKKLAVILDIDETSLSNYQRIIKRDLDNAFVNTETAANDNDDPAIPATRNLYRYAQSQGTAVFFITGRPEQERGQTIKNLHQAGFSNWDGIYFKPNSYRKKSIAPYKIAMRKMITAMGYDIVLNIGDQQSDLQGGIAELAVKLPDPFYIVP